MGNTTNELIKKEAIRIFDKLGLTEEEALQLYFTQVVLQNGIPFPITLERYSESRRIRYTKRIEEVDDSDDES